MDSKLEIRVSNILKDLGVPASLTGYLYLREAIVLAVRDTKLLRVVATTLYPMVGARFDQKPTRVERAIRHAIEVAFDRGDPDTLHAYFGYSYSREKGKATNAEFIATIVDEILLEG